MWCLFETITSIDFDNRCHINCSSVNYVPNKNNLKKLQITKLFFSVELQQHGVDVIFKLFVTSRAKPVVQLVRQSVHHLAVMY